MQPSFRQDVSLSGLPRICASPFASVRTDWLAKVALLPGRTLNYGLALFTFASMSRSPTVAPSRRTLARFGVSRDAACDALTRLTAAGLAHAERKQGRTPKITLLDAQGEMLRLRN
jgi:hypothetical protein